LSSATYWDEYTRDRKSPMVGRRDRGDFGGRKERSEEKKSDQKGAAD